MPPCGWVLFLLSTAEGWPLQEAIQEAAAIRQQVFFLRRLGVSDFLVAEFVKGHWITSGDVK